MSNWDLLDGNEDGGNGGSGEDVEYVGVVEENDSAGVVREPTRQPRQAVRRVPQTNQVMYPVQSNRKNPNGVIGSSNRDAEDLVSYVDMPFGKQLGLTNEAVDRLHSTPMTDLNGQMAQRIEPGTYVMYGPNRVGAMGTEDDLYGDIIRTQDETQALMGTNGQPFTHSELAPQQQSSGAPSWFGDLFGAIADLGSGIAGAVSSTRISREEARIERLRIAAEAEASSSARDIAFQTTQLEHTERLAEIEQGADELEALRAQAAERAALRDNAPPPVLGTGGGGGGGSPVVWIVASVLGLGAVGGVIYYVTRKKDKDEDEV